MTTGGSIVCERETFDLLQSHFYRVWVKANPEEHMAASWRRATCGLSNHAARREAMEDIRRILASREALYARADAVVEPPHDRQAIPQRPRAAVPRRKLEPR